MEEMQPSRYKASGDKQSAMGGGERKITHIDCLPVVKY